METGTCPGSANKTWYKIGCIVGIRRIFYEKKGQ